MKYYKKRVSLFNVVLKSSASDGCFLMENSGGTNSDVFICNRMSQPHFLRSKA